jgi:cytochrome-b5 reductase
MSLQTTLLRTSYARCTTPTTVAARRSSRIGSTTHVDRINHLSPLVPSSFLVHRLSSSCPIINRTYSTSLASSTPPNRSVVPSKTRLFLGLSTVALLGLGFALYSSSREDTRLSINKFVPLTLSSITALTPETSSFKFAVPSSSLPRDDEGIIPGLPIKSIYLMQPDLNIQRPYTPVSAGAFNGEKEELELIIKRYPDGEVSRWMHRLKVGDEVKMRGPTITWFYQQGDYDEIIFVRRLSSFLSLSLFLSLLILFPFFE